MTDTTTHVAGPVVKISDRVIQRCCICGEKLADSDDPSMLVFWSEGDMVQTGAGTLMGVGQFVLLKELPADSCTELVEI